MLWEWLAKKTAEIVKRRYKDGTIKGYDRDDVTQEVLMYLFDNKEYAQKIYEQQSFSMLYQVVRAVIFRLQDKNSFLEFRERSLLAMISKICSEYGIEPVSENAYKVTAVLWQNPNFSAVTKKGMCSLAKVEKLMKLNEENTEITEVSFDDLSHKESSELM